MSLNTSDEELRMIVSYSVFLYTFKWRNFTKKDPLSHFREAYTWNFLLIY